MTFLLILLRANNLTALFVSSLPSRSPFGKRCTGIHDYRVSSSASQSWLPHTETQGNTIATDINVDGLHQKRLHTILYDNPFGDQFTITSKDGVGGSGGTWADLYGVVCGDATDLAGRSKTKDGWIAGGSNKRSRHVHPIYKLQIALKLRGTESDWQYKYRPQHIVHDELCMVLQKRAFRVTSNDHTSTNSALRHTASSTATSTSSVVEISLHAYNPRLTSHVLVHEIAFGPDSDPSVRGVSLWFNIAESDVTVCTPQQAKRFRWKKTNATTATKRSTSGDIDDATNGSNGQNKPSVFDSGTIDSFPMIRPHDDAAFRLATDMMKHRLAFLKRERMSSMKDRFEALQKLQRQEEWLQERFENQRRMWIQWAWPANIGRAQVDYNTPVPPVEGPYVLKDPSESGKGRLHTSSRCESISEKEDPAADLDEGKMGDNVRHIWDSFVNTCRENPAGISSKVMVSRQCVCDSGQFIVRGPYL